MAQKDHPKHEGPVRYDHLPCETPDGLCEVLEFEQGLTVIDSLAGTSISLTPPGRFVEATMERNHDTLGYVVVLHFKLGEEVVPVKLIAGTLVFPSNLEFNLISDGPPFPPPGQGVLNIINAASASAEAKAFANANASIDIDSPCCLVVPPCQTGIATYVQRGMGFFAQPKVIASGFIVILRLAWGAEEIKSVYYYAGECGKRARREIEIAYVFDPPFADEQVARFIPQASP